MAALLPRPMSSINFPRGPLVSEVLRHSALLTDLYELTMAAAYFENGFRATASFELFVRSLPPQRGYLKL
jgi:nicotinic acid phosphoribosyltransferase